MERFLLDSQNYRILEPPGTAIAKSACGPAQHKKLTQESSIHGILFTVLPHVGYVTLANSHLLWPSAFHLYNRNNHLSSVCFLGLRQNLWKEWQPSCLPKIHYPTWPLCGLSLAHQTAAFLCVAGFLPSQRHGISELQWMTSRFQEVSKGRDDSFLLSWPVSPIRLD